MRQRWCDRAGRGIAVFVSGSHRVQPEVTEIYRMSIKSFPDYKHLLQENYVEYKYIFFTII